MARKKGSGKAKSTGRKITPDNKQTDKKTDVKVKDDPGGGVAGGGGAKPAMEVTNHRHESRPSQLRQLANGGGGNEGEQTKQTSTETVRSSGSTANNATARNTSPATTNSTTTTTVEHYKSCSSSIPSVPAPPTAISVSASSNLKYLHKKFKRIASATLMEEDDAPNLKERERERESTTTVREPATGNSSLSLQSHQHQQQQLVTVVRPSATVAPLVSHTITSSSSASRPSVSSVGHHASTSDGSNARDEPTGDESTKIVAVRTPSSALLADNTLAAPADRGAPVAAAAAVIGTSAVVFDYRQQQQQQQQLQQQYHQFHPSLHPGVATVNAFHPQPLLQHHHPHPHPHLLFHHHHHQHQQGLPPPQQQQQQQQQQTSANIASSSNSSSSSTIISSSISNSNSSNSSVLLLPQSAIAGVSAVTSSSPLSMSLSSAPAAISDNCDLSVANKLAKSPYSPLGGGAVQYIVAYPQHHQQQQPPPIDQGPKYHSSLHYTNGAVSAVVEPRPQPPHRTGGLSSASSGGSSGSPSPPSSVVSNLGTSSAHHTTSSGSGSLVASGGTAVNTAVVGPGPPGRYVCPYCQMNCSKPSVLEKHIRRHTNERPFKCDLCGIAFKTKSNLYKHRRSRAHASKSQCEDPNGLSLLDDDGGSLGGSDIDDKELSNSGSEIMNYRGSPLDERVNSPQQLLVEKPYKPKFHNAALYTKVENKPIATVGPVGGLGLIGPQQAPNNASAGSAPVSHYLNGQNVESLEQHISKLISQNEAIVEVVEAPLQKKYHKITGISRGISVSGSGGSSASFSQSTPVVGSNSNLNVGAIPSQNSQPLPSVQDAAASRLANALLQQQQQQQMQSQQMQHLMQLQHQHQPQPYVASYVHLPGQQHVINLTNRPVVTPKSTVILQQQQPQPPSVVVLNGILPTGGSVPGASNSALESASSSASADRDCQNNVTSDAGSSYQPLNLTKTSAPEQVPVSVSERGMAIAPTTQSGFLVQQPLEAGETLQHPMPLYRRQVRKDSQEAQVSTISGSPVPQVATVSVSIATATTITSSTSTTPLSTTVPSSAVTTVSASSASQPPHVPLHVQVSSAGTSSGGVHRPTATPTPPLTVANHPQNPERSIIKDLLLNSRAFGVVQNPDGENGDNLYTCKMCNVSFRDVDSLKYHMICYCQGSGSNLNSPSSSSAPISPVGSPSAAAASYIRSRSVSSLKQLARSSLNPPSARTPSSLSKLAKSQLTRPRTKPENISLPSDSSSSSSVQSSTGSNAGTSFGSKGGLVVDMVQNPLPSPGPLLGNTRLVDSHRPDPGKTQQKITATDSNETLSKSASHRQHRTLSGASGSSGGHNALHLFGGELELIERKTAFEDDGDKLTMNPSLPVHRYTSGGTFTQNISGMEIEDEETQKRALHYRRTLNSGGTLIEMARTEPSGRGAPLPIVTPKVTASPTHFQFPPINSITAFNSLTLPAVPPPGQASQIVHGGKIIPFVQGMPGPNTLSSLGPAVELVPSAMERRPDPNPQSLLTIVVPSGTGNNPSLAPTHQVAGSLLAIQQPTASTPASSRIGGPAGTSLTYAHIVEAPKKQLAGVPKNGLSVREIWSPAKQQQQQQLQADFSSPSPTQAVSRKSFNFTRMADNVSPRRKADIPPLHLSVADSKAKPDEVRYFNFETMISTSEIMIKPPPPPPPPPPAPSSSATTALSVDTSSGAVGSQQESIQNAPVPPSPRPNKFLRPNTLPLKPGTFTPKRHHGITPTNNTMPLISPETPRPSKSCRELYFNGHAYTNIGLKSSTKPFYCTVNKTQPFYFQTQKQLSMYSNWQVHPENDPHPLGLRQVTVMALYDSNHHRDRRYAIAGPRKIPLAIVASRPAGGDVVSCLSGEGQVRVSPIEVKSNVPCSPAYVLATLASQQPPTITTMTPSLLPTHYSRESLSPGQQYSEKSKSSTDQALAGSEPSLMMGTSVGGGGSRHPSRSASAERALSGGFESTEEYTYVRGRGRGKYVCNECGIRCKKPSMLKKHIRTHTDVRPYSCQYCSFHFKTKGNLTKHMKSKSHFKKCTELGLNPVPVHVDDDGGDIDIEGDQQSVSSERTSTIPGDSDTATDTDGDETDDSEEMKSRLPEHEAAEGLLSLSMTRPTSACSSLGIGHQPSVGSSMEPTAAAEEAYMKQHISSYLTPEQQQSHGLLNSTSSPNPPHSPMTIVQLQQEQDPTVKLDGGSLTHPRRIITYGNGPKLEYNLLKHEQYYSDPNLGSKKKREHERSFPNASDEAARAGDADDEDDTARPIDLTKKPRHQPSARGGEIVAEVSLPIKSSTHQYNNRRGMSFHQLQQASASAPQQPLAMVTPHQSSQQMPVEHNHPMIRPLDREQLALHQQMYENRPPSKQPDQQQPQQVIVRVSDVLTPISGTANLLTTLVSNTDKIPLIVTPFEPSGGTTPGGVDENSYFHEYLKERALQDTRIKQSQMKPGSSIVMRDAPSPHQHGHPQPQHAQFPQDQIMYNFQQQHVPLQPCYEDAHAPVNVGPSMVAVVAQATLATKATPPPAALPPLTATVIPPASAATAPTTSTAPPERVYRIFSGKNERHRASPTTEATVKSVPVSHTEPPTLPEVKHSGETVRSKYVAVEADGKHNASCVSGSATVPPSVVTTSNNTLQLVSSASLRVLGNECPLVSENASPMDTLAEIAAGSVKLDVSKVQQQLSFVSEPLPMMPTPTPVTTNVRSRCNSINSSAKVAPPPVPESAKNLASEYLKLAQSVTSKRKRADSESAAGGVSDHETSSLSIPVPVVPVVMAPVAEGVQKPIATVAPIVANIAPLPSTQQQQQQQQLQPTGTSAGNGNSSTSGNGSNVQAVEVATGGGIGPARKVVVVGEDGFKKTVGGGRPVASAGGEFVGTPPSAFTPSMHQEDGGRPVCEICNKKFHKLSQLSIHMNIHYMERKYRCEPCGTSFRSQGLYLKHERSATHRNKVSMTTTFGVATDTNPRPFYCRDCEVGFRIHGHLAKHLRSKMHVLKLECLGKLPFGTYTEIERSGTNLTEIDTSDCENSLSSLKRLAVRLNVKDPAKVLPAGGSAAGSSSSSTSSTGSGGAMGAVGGVGGGTSGNETDSCDDNFGLENGEDEFPLGAGGSKGETTPDDVSHSQRAIVNGEKGIDGVSDGALETATTCNGGRELRNINNNVKRKIDDMPSVGKGVEEATCSTSGGVLSEAKRPRYSLELLDGAGSSDVPAEGGVSTSG
uniref:Uncharacterized protein n=1 Tax=Anopheles atroparvus TaxID=41427 RepID=A0AAG5D8H2_ANOAO